MVLFSSNYYSHFYIGLIKSQSIFLENNFKFEHVSYQLIPGGKKLINPLLIVRSNLRIFVKKKKKIVQAYNKNVYIVKAERALSTRPGLTMEDDFFSFVRKMLCKFLGFIDMYKTFNNYLQLNTIIFLK